MPAAARAGAGYSQASRLSFMPCSASTTAVSATPGGGIQLRYGSTVPSRMTNPSEVCTARVVAAPSGA